MDDARQGRRTAADRKAIAAAKRGAEAHDFYVVEHDRHFLNAFERSRGHTLDSVLAELKKYFHDEDEGYAARDLVVWRSNRVRAVVRKGAGGRPEVTRFDDEN